MSLALRPGVSFCLSGERAIFLDRRSDRYLGLDPARTRHLLAGRVDSLDDLLARDLIEVRPDAPPPQPCAVTPADCDLDTTESDRTHRSDLPLVVGAVLHARLALATIPLGRLLQRRERDRTRARPSWSQDRVEGLAQRFRSWRPLAPSPTVCLLDSLALCTFLGWRGAGATLVFAVDMPPFTAHAWVQAGRCVLNDAVERTAIYTPILAIDL
jgi:hypothetical protein